MKIMKNELSPPTHNSIAEFWVESIIFALMLKIMLACSYRLGDIPDTHFSKNLFQINELRLLDIKARNT